MSLLDSSILGFDSLGVFSTFYSLFSTENWTEKPLSKAEPTLFSCDI